MNLKDELFLITDALNEAEIDYALCGGFAVIIHGYPRLTRDIDILILESALDQTRLILKKQGYTIEAGIIPFDKGEPTERQIFRTTKISGEDHLTLDLVIAAPFLMDVWKDRERIEVNDKRIDVVSRDGLIKMKKIAGRPQDLADLSKLENEPGE